MVPAAGQGEGFCGEERFPVRAGDVVVFPPQSVHGIDVSEDAAHVLPGAHAAQ